MSEAYRSMWTGLGLDLEAHDALLGVLGNAYQEIYLSQKGRPEAMGYFDFVMSEVHGPRIKELLDEKAAGGKEHSLPAHRDRLRHGGCRAAEDAGGGVY